MAGKRNINRLRKALKKNDTAGTIKKAAQSVSKAAQSAATSASVKRGASAVRSSAQSVGRKYSGSGDSESGSYIRNSRLNANRGQGRQRENERKRTTTKSVMERYQNRNIAQTAKGNGGAIRKAQYKLNDEQKNLTLKQKQTLKKNKERYDKGFGGISEGVVKRYSGSLISSAADMVEDTINYLSKTMPNGKALDIGSSAAKSLYNNTVGRADKKLSTDSLEKKIEKTGGKLQKSGQKDIDKAKEGKSKAAQWGIDLGTAAAEMGLDALLTRGRGTMGAMYARSYGSAKQSALDEGANEKQARNYGRAVGGLEAATEKMFSVAKPLKSLFGKGAADDVMETLVNKMASKATSKAGKNVAYHGSKTLASALTEGLEEMVSEGLDPVIANTIYANSIGKPHSTSAGDIFYAGSIGAAMGGILGGAGQVVEYEQGRKVQNVFGDDGVKKLAEAASQVDDIAESTKGTALNEMIKQGQGVAAGQANELYRTVYNQEMKDLERNNLIGRSTNAIMKRENLISPIQVNEETGEAIVGVRTVQEFNERKAEATGAVNQLVTETDLQLPETSVEQITNAVAAVQTGIGGIDEVNLFTLANPEARTIYTAVTGKTLPETNQKTREMLFEEIGKNRVNSARLETESYVDQVQGLVSQDMAQYYEPMGQEAFSQAFSDVNVANVAQVGDSVNTFDDFYRAGRNGISYADVINAANPAHENVSAKLKKTAWQAGQQDAHLAADTARGLQMKIGEVAAKSRSQRNAGGRGRLYSDISKENRVKFTASQQGMYRMLARTFGIDIRVVDSLESGANGEYHDGVVYLSMSSDRALEYVFAHEITHHMQDYAPEEYNRLKELVRTKWAQQGGIDEAVELKMARYAANDVKLNREQALDEIIADSTYEMLQDEEFVDELCKTHRGVAQAILDAIKGVLRKLRAVIADGDRFTPVQNEALLTELDILKEFEKMWTDGLMRAAENRAAVGNLEQYENHSTNWYQLGEYSDALLRQWHESKKIVVYENDAQLSRFIDEAIDNKNVGQKMYLGIINGELAQRIYDDTGVDVNGLNLTLRKSEIRKIFKDHGDIEREKLRGQISVTKQDMINIPKIISEPDEIIHDTQGFEGSGDAITFKKSMNGIVTAVTYLSKGPHDLIVQTMYINKKRNLATAADVQASALTSETNNSTVSNNSISDNSENSNKKFSIPETDSEGNSLTEHDSDIRYSLKNENITPDTKIPFVQHTSYKNVKRGNNKDLKELQDRVKNLERGTYENKATGYKADINGKTIGKLLSPSKDMRKIRWRRKYLDNLNAAIYLPKLFENAVYIDTKEPQKVKNEGKQIQGYHHFVAPIYMDNSEYRVRIVAREKANSDLLYIVDTEILKIKDGASVLPGQKPRNFGIAPSDISIPELINGVKIYDYDMQEDDVYTQNDIKYSLPDESDVIDYVNEHGTEFTNVLPVRDYEKKQRAVRQQTYGELLMQVEKLKKDKRFTKGKVLDEKSVREEMNRLVVTLMSYSESYTVNGGKRKTNHELVRDGVHAASRIFTAMKNGDYLEAINTAELAAEDIVGRLELVNDRAFHEYRELREYLRKTRIMISEEDANNIPDFKEFKKEQANRLRIVHQNGIPVDAVYGELLEMYPGLLPEDATHPADQLMEMAELRESLEPYEIMLSAEETEQLVKQTAQDLLDIAARGKAFKSWADKKAEQYDERLKRVKARHKEALRDVKRNERERTERMLREERQKWAERVNHANERADRRVQEEKDKRRKLKHDRVHVRHFGNISKNVKTLSDWLLRPTDEKHIPEAAKREIAHLLMQVDLQTERSKKLEKKYGRAKKTVQMDSLKARYEELTKSRDGESAPVFFDDGTVVDLLAQAAENRIGDKSIDQLTNGEMKAIDILLSSIVHNIKNYNKNFSDSLKQTRTELAEATIKRADETIARRGKYKKEKGGWAGDFLSASNITPREIHEYIGGGMKDAFAALRKGFDKHIDNITSLRTYFEELFRKHSNSKKPGSKLEKWRGKKHAIKVQLDSGHKMEISIAQAMSIYCASKRAQYKAHLINGGITLTDISVSGKVAGIFTGDSNKLSSQRYTLTFEDIDRIIGKLTEEQREVADRLQGDILNGKCKDWGNETSLTMYGYRKFTEENYFPIKSRQDWLATDEEGKKASLESILNAGFTKVTTPGASNPVVIDDIFSVVAAHANKMSQYNALAAPIADYVAVFNYKGYGKDRVALKEKIGQAWGSRYVNYMERFIQDVNGNFRLQGKDALEKIAAKNIANYKAAAILASTRVAIQQPTAIVRASMIISPRFFATPKGFNVKKNMKDMKDHCQIARWKSWGFTQVDMANDIEDIMMNKTWSRGEVLTAGAYSGLDLMTWSFIWAAVKAETRSKYKNVKYGSAEFYEICNERASEVFDKTQVVDSVFHRSQAMRNTDIASKMFTSFGAEPTKSYSMVWSQFALAHELAKDGDRAGAMRKIIRSTVVYVNAAAATAAAAAVVDAFLKAKDVDGDDEPDGWWENFLNNFWGNVNPMSMIPILRDVPSWLDGWNTDNMAIEGLAETVKSLKVMYDKMVGESDKTWSEIIRDFAENLGYLTGKPVKNILREIENWSAMFGINVFAAEEGEEETEKSERGLIDKVADKVGIKDGSSIDNILNRFGLHLSDEEKKEAEYKEKLASVREKIEGLSEEEKQETIWDEVTENYTTYIKDGDMEKLAEMRRLLDDLGGDVETFDERVTSEVKTSLKKNIGKEGDPNKIWEYRTYLLKQGMTDAEISGEVVAKSDTAKEFQIALCTNDEDAAIEALMYLRDAGISYEDGYVLFVNRTKAIKGSDFSSGELVYPVNGEITSEFGYRSLESTNGIGSTYHEGIDIGAPLGSDVAAADGGKVTYAGWKDGYGYQVKVSHGNGRETWYSHLNCYYVQKGDAVTKGQVIAAVGNTGNSTGPHLDFRVREGTTFVDPMMYFR